MLIGVCLLFLILGIVFLSGRGAFLIAGYNTMSKERKSQYNEKRLCRGMGFIMLGMSISILLLYLDHLFIIPVIRTLALILLFMIPTYGIIYLNLKGTESVLKKGINIPSKSESLMLIVLFIGIGIFYVYSSQDPTINIRNEALHISGLYGRTIDFSEISNVKLLDESMREIGAGTRRNGFGGLNTSKGRFDAGLLFVQTNSAPTLLIEREDGADIFISFRDNQETRELFEQLQAYMD